MKNKLIRQIGVAIVVVLWLVLTLCAWFSPAEAFSDAERRPLKQFPELSVKTLLDGDFMKKFESYTLDQFPLRDSFRQVKSLFHYNVLQQKDNNKIYMADGHAAKLEYPFQPDNTAYALKKFQAIYDSYLKEQGSKVYAAVVPDKGYYLARDNGYPVMDYPALFDAVRQGMPWATHIELTDLLSIGDYYTTDTHWRQEKILDVAQRITEAMGMAAPQAEAFTPTAVERPFYGVYYGQAALPMASETMYLMENDDLNACTVTIEGSKTAPVYDRDKLAGKDMYEVFLSGSVSLAKIENPNASTDRELIIFRDSFGSSLAPLLISEYKTVTLVDIRYISSQMLPNFIDFHGQDVLFLYSTLVLNNGTTLK